MCLTTLYKDDPLKPFICPHCGWRSDRPDASHARLTHLTDSYSLA